MSTPYTYKLILLTLVPGGKIKPAGAKAPVYGNWHPNLVCSYFYLFKSQVACSDHGTLDLRRLDVIRNRIWNGRADSKGDVSNDCRETTSN